MEGLAKVPMRYQFPQRRAVAQGQLDHFGLVTEDRHHLSSDIVVGRQSNMLDWFQRLQDASSFEELGAGASLPLRFGRHKRHIRHMRVRDGQRDGTVRKAGEREDARKGPVQRLEQVPRVSPKDLAGVGARSPDGGRSTRCRGCAHGRPMRAIWEPFQALFRALSGALVGRARARPHPTL